MMKRDIGRDRLMIRRIGPVFRRRPFARSGHPRFMRLFWLWARWSRQGLPFGMLKPGNRNSPSPTPPFRRLASLTILARRFFMYSTCLTSSSAGTCVDSAVNALCAAFNTSGLSSFNLYTSSRIMIGIIS